MAKRKKVAPKAQANGKREGDGGIKLVAGALLTAWVAAQQFHADVISSERVSVLTLVQARRLRANVLEYHDALVDRLKPIIVEYTGGEDSIGPEHKKFSAFMKDERTQKLLNESIPLDFEPLRLGGRDIAASGQALDVLLDLGLVTE